MDLMNFLIHLQAWCSRPSKSLHGSWRGPQSQEIYMSASPRHESFQNEKLRSAMTWCICSVFLSLSRFARLNAILQGLDGDVMSGGATFKTIAAHLEPCRRSGDLDRLPNPQQILTARSKRRDARSSRSVLNGLGGSASELGPWWN